MIRFLLLVATLALFSLSQAIAESPDVARQTLLKTWQLVESKFFDSNLNGVDPESVKSEYLQKVEEEPERAVELINESLELLNASHTQLYCQDDPLYYELLDVFGHSKKGERIRALFRGDVPRYTGVLAKIKDARVMAVVPGGPAAIAGLQVGDAIQSVDGKSFHPMVSFSAQNPVRVTVNRDGHILKKLLVPKEIQPREAFLQSISDSAKVIDDPPYKIGYVRMWSFAGIPYRQRLQEILASKLRQTDGLVLDLRGTWGGASPDSAELFLSQTDLEIINRRGESSGIRAPGYPAPIMILTDDTVSSGKEVLAHNLQKSGRATIVGSPTRGAVLGGAVHLLPDGYALYLVEVDVTIDGKRLEGVGVIPDHYLPKELHFEDGQDILLRNGQGFLLLALIERDLKARWHIDQQIRSAGGSLNLDKENQDWLKALLQNHGWPTRDLFQESAQTAWLIAQHADNDLAFQEYCLDLLTKAVEKGKAPAKERAYLEDRVLVNQGLPQIYGTQMTQKNGKTLPREIRDPDGVDARRKSVGLGTLKEYMDSFPSR